MKKKIMMMTKGVVAAYVLSAICLAVLAFVIFKWEVSDEVVRGGIIFSYIISCFVGGCVSSAGGKGRRYLHGLLCGLIYYIILMILSVTAGGATLTHISGMMSTFFLCCLGGMLGGMMQAGRKK